TRGNHMSPCLDLNLSKSPDDEVSRSRGRRTRQIRSRLTRQLRRTQASPVELGARNAGMMMMMIVFVAALGAATPTLAPPAYAMPAPEVEYVYDVMVRRHYTFASPEAALDYGRQICGKVSQGEKYAQVMGDVKIDVLPNDEFAANYLVSYAVNLLCPNQIWQL